MDAPPNDARTRSQWLRLLATTWVLGLAGAGAHLTHAESEGSEWAYAKFLAALESGEIREAILTIEGTLVSVEGATKDSATFRTRGALDDGRRERLIRDQNVAVRYAAGESNGAYGPLLLEVGGALFLVIGVPAFGLGLLFLTVRAVRRALR